MISAETRLRQAVEDLLSQSATAWVDGCPNLAERLYIAAAALLGRFELEPSEDAR